MQKRWYSAFLDGYKPATIELRTHESYEQLKIYPHIHPYNSHSEDCCMFFQTEEQKREYITQRALVQEDSYDYHVLVGTTLGFPSKSVTFFADYFTRDDRGEDIRIMKHKVGIRWAGFYFATHLDMVEGEARWLWDTYRGVKTAGEPLVLVAIGDDNYEVPHLDWNALATAVQKIKKNRGLLPEKVLIPQGSLLTT